MQNIKLSLSVDEVNLILESLGEQSYSKIRQLIANIHQQAQKQLQQEQPSADEKK